MNYHCRCTGTDSNIGLPFCPLKNSDNIQCSAFGTRLVGILANVNSRSTHLHVHYMLSPVRLSSATLLRPTRVISANSVAFGSHCVKVVEDIPNLSAA